MIRKAVPFIVALLVLCGQGLVSVRAQEGQAEASQQAGAREPAPSTQQRGAMQSSPESADLSITANVTARELRFEVVGDPKVEFTGKPERTTVWESERQNLPRPVEPGVTYRNIGIQLKITSVFADIDRIVAEALGEVPRSEDATPTPTQPAPQPEAAPPSSPPPDQPKSEGSPPR